MNKRILLLAAGVLIGLLLGWGLSTLGALGEKKSRSAAVNSTGVSPGDEETSRDWQSQDLGDPGLRHAEASFPGRGDGR